MNDADRQIWAGMLAHLRAHHPNLCRQWFEEILPLGMAGGVLRLRAASTLHRDYLQRSCLSEFNDAARTVSGRLISVRFAGPHDADDAPAPDADHAPAQRTGRPSAGVEGSTTGMVLNPDYAFENFVVGPGNRLAHAAALAIAASPSQVYNPFFIHGGVGLGKTHLLQAVCIRVRQSRPGAVIHYTSCEGFITRFIESVQAGAMARFRHEFRDVDVLVIDDIHFLVQKERTQEEFFHTFNTLYNAGKQIVLSSDSSPKEIPTLQERLVSRFKWGLVTEIESPCFETRVAILKRKSRERGREIPDGVAQLVAEHVDTNIRELEGAVNRLIGYAALSGQEITPDLARHVLRDAFTAPRCQPSMEDILRVVTAHFNVKVTDLQSRRRTKAIAHPRQIGMYLARQITRHSLEEIGGFYGGRDHTTVLYAVEQVDKQMREDQRFRALIAGFLDQLRP